MKNLTDPQRTWVPAIETDIKKTWEKFYPDVVKKMKYQSGSAMPSHVIHIKPKNIG